jgi:hypothetical protein
MLSARPTGPVEIYLQILLVYFNIDIVTEFRNTVNSRKAGVPPTL